MADFGGGGMLLALGVVSAVLSARQTGEGQVVDAAMVDGVALLMAPFFMAMRSGYFTNERGTNLLDSGAPFYDSYLCADGRYVAVGAIEPQFYAALAGGAGARRRGARRRRTTRRSGLACGSGSRRCS